MGIHTPATASLLQAASNGSVRVRCVRSGFIWLGRFRPSGLSLRFLTHLSHCSRCRRRLFCLLEPLDLSVGDHSQSSVFRCLEWPSRVDFDW